MVGLSEMLDLPGKNLPFKRSSFLPDQSQVKHLTMPHNMGWLLTLPADIKTVWKNLLETNTVAYFGT
jgi:hypothetical protein